VATSFYRWTTSGLWQRILSALHATADAARQIDWSVHHVDSTIIRAHQHAADARGGQHRQALGRSRGGFSTKLHIRCDGHGRPMVFALASTERHDSIAVEDLLAGGRVKRSSPGRPRHRPEAVVGDRAYSSHATRRSLRRRGIQPIIPQKQNERPAYLMDWSRDRERNRIERLGNRLKQHRRIATRYDKTAPSYAAFVALAALRMWL
jgi:transposase